MSKKVLKQEIKFFEDDYESGIKKPAHIKKIDKKIIEKLKQIDKKIK